jgi:hypothetical protein
MPTFSHYSAKLSELRPADEPSKMATPAYVMTLEYVHFAENYISAAGVIAGTQPPHHYLPLMQLTGHAIECAMKACISATGGKLPKGAAGHNLVSLADRILELGFEATEPEKAFVVHVNHLYASDLYTGTTFKARYPSQDMERLGGSIPPHEVLRMFVSSLCQQATRRNEKQSPVVAPVAPNKSFERTREG